MAAGASRPEVAKRAYYPVLGTGLAADINADFMSVTVPLWAVMLGATPAEIGIMIGARSFLPFLLAIHGGVLMDRLGTRRMMLIFTLLGAALVIPEPGFLGQCLQLGDALLFGLEVKDAPRSTGSVQPGPGWRRNPPSSGPGDPGAGWGAAR